jgi:S-adenosylmethionine decarboxylase
MEDLAPTIHRQRLVIEGYPSQAISDDMIQNYLGELSRVIDMNELITPVTHRSERFGWAGWIHWETSGAHFYAWEEPVLFFSVDIYTCKPFRSEDAVEFTRNFFDVTKIVSKDFSS